MANENNVPPPGATTVWERPIDLDHQRRRVTRFVRWYVLPCLGIILLGGILGGFGAAAGLLILLGLFGALLGGWVLVQNMNERSAPTLWVADGHLHLNRRKGIPLDQVDVFSVKHTSQSLPVNGVSSSTSGVTATFLATGVLLEWMKWPGLKPSEVPRLTAAITTVLPGKNISSDEMLRRLRA